MAVRPSPKFRFWEFGGGREGATAALYWNPRYKFAMTTARQALGRWGEDAAAQYLTRKGYALLETNARTPYGEIDLVARLGDTLIFVEVKTRSSRAYGVPETSITPQKQEHLIASAEAWLEERPALHELDWRIDVIAIERPANAAPRIKHIENAVTG